MHIEQGMRLLKKKGKKAGAAVKALVFISQLAVISGALASQHEHCCGGEVLEHMWIQTIFVWCLEDKEQPARARKKHQLHEYAACGAVFLQHPDSERHDFGNLCGGSRGADGLTSTKLLHVEIWVKSPL